MTHVNLGKESNNLFLVLCAWKQQWSTDNWYTFCCLLFIFLLWVNKTKVSDFIVHLILLTRILTSKFSGKNDSFWFWLLRTFLIKRVKPCDKSQMTSKQNWKELYNFSYSEIISVYFLTVFFNNPSKIYNSTSPMKLETVKTKKKQFIKLTF